jgi:hypothetical protein
MQLLKSAGWILGLVLSVGVAHATPDTQAKSQIGCLVTDMEDRAVWITVPAVERDALLFQGVAEFQIYRPLSHVIEMQGSNAQVQFVLERDSQGVRQVRQFSAQLGRSGQFEAQIQDIETGDGTFVNHVFCSTLPRTGSLNCQFHEWLRPRPAVTGGN